jgi:predicted RNA binding protein YcfA (HicA-like mRNA interferase family)
MSRLPACTPTDVIRALGRAGFFLDHSAGSHRYYRHPNRPGVVTVPFHRRELKHGTLLASLKLTHYPTRRLSSVTARCET